jgi:hypothetical protein
MKTNAIYIGTWLPDYNRVLKTITGISVPGYQLFSTGFKIDSPVFWFSNSGPDFLVFFDTSNSKGLFCKLNKSLFS